MNPYSGYPYQWDYQAYWRNQHIRYLRHSYSVQGWALLIYMGIMNAAVFLVMFLDAMAKTIHSMSEVGAVDEAWVEESMMRNSGWGYLLAIVVGFVILLLWKKPRFAFGIIWQKKRPMKVGGFFQILSLFLSTQMVFILLSVLVEFLLNQVGVTSVTESALDYDSLSMFLYVGLGAPIAEELLFRGLILRSMEPYGKKFAIFASALLFGLFHGNLSQGLFAFVVGLVLGYVTVEHNIGWAMALHMFNNLIVSDVTTRLSQLFPGGIVDLMLIGVLVLFTVAAIVILIVQRKKIRTYLKSNRDDPYCAKAFWSAPGIITLVCVLAATVAFSIVTALVPLT